MYDFVCQFWYNLCNFQIFKPSVPENSELFWIQHVLIKLGTFALALGSINEEVYYELNEGSIQFTILIVLIKHWRI